MRAIWKSRGFCVRHAGPRITQIDVARAEKVLGCKLPVDYRSYMLRHNGGIPFVSNFSYFRTKRGIVQSTWLAGLDPIPRSTTERSMNLLWANALRQEQAERGAPLPDGCIIIGYNGADDQIMLFVRGARRGQVWMRVWDDLANHPPAVPDTEDALYLVAMSFSEFIAMLYKEDVAQAESAKLSDRDYRKRGRRRGKHMK